MSFSQASVTRLLLAVEQGDRSALDNLYAAVYDELHRRARRQRQRWRGDHTLNTTAIVHEAYLKLVDGAQAGWQDRAHFLAVAAKAMRHILINYAESRRARKRGGGAPKVPIGEVEARLAKLPMDDANAEMLLALDEALRRFARLNERGSRVIECRFFGGMTIAETAAALGISTATANREWKAAQLWLYHELSDEAP